MMGGEASRTRPSVQTKDTPSRPVMTPLQICGRKGGRWGDDEGERERIGGRWGDDEKR